MPPRSVGPATLPSDAWSPQTTTAVAVHGPEQQKQTADRRSRWEPRSLQCWDGGVRRRIMYVETVDSAISNPSFSSSPWIRGAPHNGFSLHIRRMRSRNSRSILGLPARPWDFPAPIGPKPCPMPPHDGVRLNDSDQTKQARPDPSHPYQQSPVATPQPQTLWRSPQDNI
jgi:hypothetical protein